MALFRFDLYRITESSCSDSFNWSTIIAHEPSDLILVLGSHDTRVAERGAELFLNNYAPLILFSGGLGNLTK